MSLINTITMEEEETITASTRFEDLEVQYINNTSTGPILLIYHYDET